MKKLFCMVTIVIALFFVFSACDNYTSNPLQKSFNQVKVDEEKSSDIDVSKDLTDNQKLAETAGTSPSQPIEEANPVVTKRKKNWTTNAHRGNISNHIGTLKENTLGAYHNAYLMGADVLECDARKSSDGVLMCNHDANAVDIYGNSYKISETTSTILLGLTMSSGDNVYMEQGVPTLKQVLTLAYTYGLKCDIDLKMFDCGYTNSQKREFATDVAKLVAECGMKGKVTYAISTGGSLAISTIIAIDPEATFTTTKTRFDAITDLATILPDYKSRCYAYTSDYSPSVIEGIREAGYLLECTEVTADNFPDVIKWNPDAIEYIHTADFESIERNYLANYKPY